MNGMKYIRSEVLRMSMEELATKLDVSKQAISAWETKRKNIPEIRLRQLFELTGIPKEFWLMDNVPEKEKDGLKKIYLYTQLRATRGETVSFDRYEAKDNPLWTKIQPLRTIKQIGEVDVNEHLIDRFSNILHTTKSQLIMLQMIEALELVYGIDVDDYKKERNVYLRVVDSSKGDESDFLHNIYELINKHKKELEKHFNGKVSLDSLQKIDVLGNEDDEMLDEILKRSGKFARMSGKIEDIFLICERVESDGIDKLN